MIIIYSIKDKTLWEKWLPIAHKIRQIVLIDECGKDEKLQFNLKEDENAIHLIYLEKKVVPVGTLRLRAYKDKCDNRYGYLEKVALLPATRGKGFFNIMLAAIEEKARTIKLKRILLHSFTLAIPIYEKKNFILLSDKIIHISDKNQSECKCKVMQKSLFDSEPISESELEIIGTITNCKKPLPFNYILTLIEEYSQSLVAITDHTFEKFDKLKEKLEEPQSCTLVKTKDVEYNIKTTKIRCSSI